MTAVRTHHHLGFATEEERAAEFARHQAAEIARAEATVYDARHPAMLNAAIRVLTEAGIRHERVGELGIRFAYEGRNVLASLSRQALVAERFGGEAAALEVLAVAGPLTRTFVRDGELVVDRAAA